MAPASTRKKHWTANHFRVCMSRIVVPARAAFRTGGAAARLVLSRLRVGLSPVSRLAYDEQKWAAGLDEPDDSPDHRDNGLYGLAQASRLRAELFEAVESQVAGIPPAPAERHEWLLAVASEVDQVRVVGEREDLESPETPVPRRADDARVVADAALVAALAVAAP